MTLHWCDDLGCEAKPHVDNCPDCFGFGLKMNRTPLTAMEAELADDYIECQICGGSPDRWHRMCEKIAREMI